MNYPQAVQRVRQTPKANYAIAFVTALVAPVLLFFELARDNSRAFKHWTIVLLVTIYGSTMVIQEAQDGYRHQLAVTLIYADMPFSMFVAELWKILTFQVTEIGVRDVYRHVLSYLIGGVLQMPQLFFPVVALIYGYFFGGALLEVFKDFSWKRANYVILGFIVVFLLIKNVEGINTVRTWTGFWMLMYGCLKYHSTGQKKYLIWVFITPLIHVAYFAMAVPAVMVLLLGNRITLYSVLFVASSFTTFINPGDTRALLERTELGQQQARGYFRENRAETMEVLQAQLARGDVRWYRAFERAQVHKWALNVLVYALLLAGIYQAVMTKYQQRIFSIGLLTMTMSNSVWFLYALSNRTAVIGTMFILAAYIMSRLDPNTAPAFKRSPQYYRWGIHLSLLLYFPFCLWALSTFLDFPSFFNFILPFYVWFDPEANLSVKEALRWLFLGDS